LPCRFRITQCENPLQSGFPVNLSKFPKIPPILRYSRIYSLAKSAEIAGARTPEHKFEIWAENAQQNIHPFRDGIFTKIKLLEDGLRQESGAVTGEWELVTVRVRGAVGILRGIGKDEIAVNFDDYDEGLIALCGANGKGKTTLIENCHPYPRFFTRKGKLQDHFCLRDSFREVVYRTPDGIERKFLIQIDGQNKSACKYFVFSRSTHNMDWEPAAGVDGNLKPYEEYVQSVFGPPELYLRTVHTSQRPAKNLPDLTEATAGEKKALFVELAGIEYLQRFAESALERFKAEDGRVHDAELQAGMLEQAVKEKPELERDIRNRREILDLSRSRLAVITEQGKLAKAEVERLEAAAAKEVDRGRRERNKRDDIEDLEQTLLHDRQVLEKYEAVVRNRAAYEEQAQMWDHYAAVISAETEVKQRILEKNLQTQREFSRKQQEHQQKVRETEQGKQQLVESRQSSERMIRAEEAEIRFHERDAGEFDQNCPTCGQDLPVDKIQELSQKRNAALSFIETHREEIRRFEKDIAALDEKINRADQSLEVLAFNGPRPDEEEPFDDTSLLEAQASQGKIFITKVRAALAEAGEAQALAGQCAKTLEEGSRRLEDWKAELAGLEAAADPALIRELAEAREKHSVLTADYTEARETIARLEAELAAREDRLADIKTRETELAALRATTAAAKTEGAEWDLIARGFGRDGIQALELDALAPGIAETANRILSSAYGERFRIEIRTTRMGGAGKRTRQIEDFLIYVIDAEDGEAVLLDDKSGGESVWIKRALYDAFAVIRKRNTGFSFRTCFQDEADGALDSAAKTAYCRMLEAAHAESGLRHTVIITHSEEVKAMIPQKIDMEDL
jgi:exonuclease SbcC